MLVYADLRCLQDPGFARRGIGSHAAFLLAAARRLRRGAVTVIGLVDRGLPPLADEVAELCDGVQASFAPRCGQPGLFLWLSPMTHDTRPVSRFFDRPEILPCAVVFDFIPLLDPCRYLATPAARCSYAAALEWLGAARAFLPISEAVGGELVERLGVDGEAVTVTGVALREAFAERLREAAPAPRPAGVTGEYVLFVGGPDGRKNLETVVAAAGLAADPGRPVTLVAAGGYPPRWRRRIERSAAGGRVRLAWLDHVDDRELAGWYAHARATVVASRAEGFSMPVIEAMACGSPVLASDIPCHRELVGDPAARFDPGDPDDLARRLRSLLADPSVRAGVVAAQSGVPRRFVAERVAERFVAALELRLPGHERRARRIVAARRPALAIVSPFPPDRSGVADYTRRTVAALAARADVDVWTDAPVPEPDPHVRAFHRISPAAWLRPDYDATVAVLGNSHFHGSILDGHLRSGGPCILHDSRLVDLYAWWHGIGATRRLAESELGRPVTAGEAREWTCRQESLPTLFLSEAVRCGDPVFVHSRGLADEVRRLYGVEAVTLPFALLREFSPLETALPARRAARARLGIRPDERVVVTLGIYGPTKAPDTCLETLARLRGAGHDATLVFVGASESAASALLGRAVAGGLGAAVRCTGEWLAEAEYRAWILAADAAIQLRTHRSGGISAALMDCIVAGLPTVANEDLAAALDAPASVRRVTDDFTAAAVAAALGPLLGGPVERDEAARLRYCAEHSMAAYAERLLDALGVGGGAEIRRGARRVG